jgi:bifunctional non-homologous end joining protein LigD
MGNDLRDYRKKRDFARTPEPAPAVDSRRPPGAAFVVHRHEATRLHYDLRLESEGVLASFAVPRGFSYLLGDLRLAVRTEDHPLEYLDFHGVIPAGEYGAGTMTIWDAGTYVSLLGDLREGLEAGKLELRLDGRRLHGEWHLVRKTEKEWLLLKGRDVYARKEGDAVWPLDLDLAAAERRPPPRRPRPMRPRDEAAPFSDPDWVFELRFDGRRVFAEKRDDEARLLDAAAGRLLANPPEEVLEAIRGLRAEAAVVDGVLVALDESERPSRELLDRRLAGESDAPVQLQAFDLLQMDAWSLRALPLLERKRLLAALRPPSAALVWVDHVVGEGERLAEVVAAAGLPGAIAKEASSRYRGGPSRAWRRIAVEPREAAKPLSEVLAVPDRTGSGRVKYGNVDKVFWPESGLTKGDLLRYYERVAEFLLPHLHERPIHMRRFPDGIEGKSFYHKDVPDHAPEWIETEPIESGDEGRTIRYVVCNDRDTLLWLANLGSVDLHPWMSRRGSLDAPDYVVLDLDPDGTPFPTVVRIARLLGRLLRGVGIRPHVKTSGASGMHVVVPLEPRYTYDQARLFAEMIARTIAKDHEDICTLERSTARRRGRVYLDVLQNRRGQTVVPPYVARPVPAASVSMPLDWDELDGDLDPAAFTILNAAERIATRGDLARGLLDDRQPLEPAIEAFAKRFA